MRRFTRLVPVACTCALLCLAAACGKKAPPLAPLVIRPVAPENLEVVRVADTVVVSFRVPERNSDGKAPARLSRVDVYALTGEPKDVDGIVLTPPRFLEAAARVGTVEIEPPPPPAPKVEEGREPPPAPPVPEDPRPAQGQVAWVAEAVTPALLEPFVPTGKPKRRRVMRPVGSTLPLPLVPVATEPLGRTYFAVGRDHKGRAGAQSSRVTVHLTDTPPAPDAPTLSQTESAIVVEWVVPSTARRDAFGVGAAAASPSDDDVAALTPRALFPGPIPHSMNVYVVESPSAAATADRAAIDDAVKLGVRPPLDMMPVNPAPLTTTRFEDAGLTVGVERCYRLRMVEARPMGRVEGPPSPRACITPVDTFPPRAPTGLAAVGSEGAVNLIWEPNVEADLAGYLVLRGEVGATSLEAVTPAPIRETIYRDTQVTRGQRYVYAIVAIDSVTPPNRSGESTRVEETAR